jgi:hypothetical protein
MTSEREIETVSDRELADLIFAMDVSRGQHILSDAGNKLILALRELQSRRSPTPEVIHASDCAVHNEPAMPNGPCDCGVDEVLTLRHALNSAVQYMRDAGAFLEDFPVITRALKSPPRE